jgi:hypothetical protein
LDSREVVSKATRVERMSTARAARTSDDEISEEASMARP